MARDLNPKDQEIRYTLAPKGAVPDAGTETGAETETFVIKRLAWDTKVLGLSCGRITEISSPLEEHKALRQDSYFPLLDELRRSGLQYVTIRRSIREWRRIQALEGAGFRLVDGILEFRMDLRNKSTVSASAHDGFEFRLATAEDADVVGQLAMKTFVSDRFHNDPLLTKDQADAVYLEWGRDACRGLSADSVWLIVTGGAGTGAGTGVGAGTGAGRRLAGFVTCELKKNEGLIGLIAVAAESAGAGLGSHLVRRACAWFQERGCDAVTVLTQIDNYPAIRLYQSTGWAPVGTYVTLRWANFQR